MIGAFARKTAAASMVATMLTCASTAQEWDYTLRPYVWVPGFDLSFTVDRDPPSGGDSSIWDKFEGAFLLQGSAHRGEWTLLGEFNYLKLGDTYLASVPVLQTEAGLDGYMAGVGAGRRLHEGANGFLEVFGGVRYWDVTLTGYNSTAGRAQVARNWIDPIVGLRGQYVLGSKTDLVGRFDIGGFGVGSKLQTDIQAALNWTLTPTTQVSLGYRHLKIKLEDSRLVADVTLRGPFAALNFRF